MEDSLRLTSGSNGSPDPGRAVVAERTHTYSLMDVFAGCGGMTRGFLDSGHYRPVFAVESDPQAIATYRLNFGDDVAESRIEDVAAFPPVDVLIGGPPCQGFSALNRNAVGFERRGLWREYLRALRLAEPRVFVMENVPALLRSAEYAEFKRRAGQLGYVVEEEVLNAADYGVPQIRKRAIVIGAQVGTAIRWPQPAFSDPDVPRLGAQHPWVTFREAVEGLPIEPDDRSWHKGRNPRPEHPAL